ncbi:sugar-binding protein [Neobacillus mesonae]|uniref:sugar-binding protein n=1 Tax=Neobacillus mesonae TaxID=1193713 RepID=UPI00257403B5|nr:sugar-binding protein [Neobacillus mesonae]MED4203588.1 sugar-binding protein [Neobacillus mesonae]
MKRLLYGSCILLLSVSVTLSIYFTFKVLAIEAQSKPMSPKKYDYHFVLVPEELDNDYWRLVEKGAKDAAKEHHVLLEYVGPAQADLKEQIKTIERSAASRVDGLLTQALNEKQFTPLINKIDLQGIPVITIDTDAPKSNRIAYIGTNNYYSGFIAGLALAKDLKGKANVAIITGRFEASHQQLRVQGFKDAVKNYKGIKVIAIEESNISRVQAAEKTYTILKEHPEVNAFFGTSALDGIGIAKVIQQFHRENSTYIISFDVLPETIAYLKEGVIEATVVQEPYEMGYQAIKMMIAHLEGKRIANSIYTETKVVYRKDLPLVPERNYEVRR